MAARIGCEVGKYNRGGPCLHELSRRRKTNYVTTNLRRVKKKQESNWQRRDSVVGEESRPWNTAQRNTGMTRPKPPSLSTISGLNPRMAARSSASVNSLSFGACRTRPTTGPRHGAPSSSPPISRCFAPLLSSLGFGGGGHAVVPFGSVPA
ncbi:hypothetical protein ZEAMMB73_Zm00001d020856 [Zea mays]|uniref:Uncharacterized protein n=1 Tax=Zea mays TaxID=4577 RepID=A0A1D6I6N4_MAIZE|nr:hypothetical protein ZEAMMB73_Zm00001d020856 [Zea mays]